jgi:hypothetical protein
MIYLIMTDVMISDENIRTECSRYIYSIHIHIYLLTFFLHRIAILTSNRLVLNGHSITHPDYRYVSQVASNE